MNKHFATPGTISSMKSSYDRQHVIASKLQSQEEEADISLDMAPSQLTGKVLRTIKVKVFVHITLNIFIWWQWLDEWKDNITIFMYNTYFKERKGNNDYVQKIKYWFVSLQHNLRGRNTSRCQKRQLFLQHFPANRGQGQYAIGYSRS